MKGKQYVDVNAINHLYSGILHGKDGEVKILDILTAEEVCDAYRKSRYTKYIDFVRNFNESLKG